MIAMDFPICIGERVQWAGGKVRVRQFLVLPYAVRQNSKAYNVSDGTKGFTVVFLLQFIILQTQAMIYFPQYCLCNGNK